MDMTTRQRILLLLTALAMLLLWISRIDGTPITSDATENVRMALNLERSGVISLSEAPPIVPTMFREPLPIAAGAVAIRVLDAALGPADSDEYFRGLRVELLKYQNILWLTILSVTLFMIGQQLALRFVTSLLCVVLSNLLLLGEWYRLCMLNGILTESAAAALLTLGSLLLVKGSRSGGRGFAAAAGICFGLLALTKAVFLYVILGLVVGIPLLALAQRRSVLAASTQAIVMVAVALVCVVPWMLRNHFALGAFELASRSGIALHDRQVLDQMTRAEYRGSFYAWAPYPLGGAFRRLLGYEKSDFDEGGRLQRLNDSESSAFAARDRKADLEGRPDETLSLYHYSGAQATIIIRQFVAAGDPHPLITAEREMKQQALAYFKAHPVRHLALVLPLMMRGGYFAFPPLALMFIYALRRQRVELATLLMPALAMVVFYSLASSFESRYAFPAYPLAACALVVLAEKLMLRLRS